MHGPGAGDAALVCDCSNRMRPPRCSPRASQSSVCELGEAEHLAQQRLAAGGVGDQGAHAPRSPGGRTRAGTSRLSGRSAARRGGRTPPSSWRMPSGSANSSRPGSRCGRRLPSPLSRSCQKSSASSEATRWTMREIIPAPARPGAAPGVLEERDVGAGRAVLVGVEEVVDAGVVLVDRLLDQPQAEHAGVEVDVAARVAGDQGDVVDAVDRIHGVRCSSLAPPVVGLAC